MFVTPQTLVYERDKDRNEKRSTNAQIMKKIRTLRPAMTMTPFNLPQVQNLKTVQKKKESPFESKRPWNCHFCMPKKTRRQKIDRQLLAFSRLALAKMVTRFMIKEEFYESKKVVELLNTNSKSFLVATFKEYLIYDDIYEFLTSVYAKSESVDILRRHAEFYAQLNDLEILSQYREDQIRDRHLVLNGIKPCYIGLEKEVIQILGSNARGKLRLVIQKVRKVQQYKMEHQGETLDRGEGEQLRDGEEIAQTNSKSKNQNANEHKDKQLQCIELQNQPSGHIQRLTQVQQQRAAAAAAHNKEDQQQLDYQKLIQTSLVQAYNFTPAHISHQLASTPSKALKTPSKPQNHSSKKECLQNLLDPPQVKSLNLNNFLLNRDQSREIEFSKISVDQEIEKLCGFYHDSSDCESHILGTSSVYSQQQCINGGLKKAGEIESMYMNAQMILDDLSSRPLTRSSNGQLTSSMTRKNKQYEINKHEDHVDFAEKRRSHLQFYISPSGRVTNPQRQTDDVQEFNLHQNEEKQIDDDNETQEVNVNLFETDVGDSCLISHILAEKKPKVPIQGSRKIENENERETLNSREAYEKYKTDYQVNSLSALNTIAQKNVQFQQVDFVVTDESPSLEPHETFETFDDRFNMQQQEKLIDLKINQEKELRKQHGKPQSASSNQSEMDRALSKSSSAKQKSIHSIKFASTHQPSEKTRSKVSASSGSQNQQSEKRKDVGNKEKGSGPPTPQLKNALFSPQSDYYYRTALSQSRQNLSGSSKKVSSCNSKPGSGGRVPEGIANNFMAVQPVQNVLASMSSGINLLQQKNILSPQPQLGKTRNHFIVRNNTSSQFSLREQLTQVKKKVQLVEPCLKKSDLATRLLKSQNCLSNFSSPTLKKNPSRLRTSNRKAHVTTGATNTQQQQQMSSLKQQTVVQHHLKPSQQSTTCLSPEQIERIAILMASVSSSSQNANQVGTSAVFQQQQKSSTNPQIHQSILKHGSVTRNTPPVSVDVGMEKVQKMVGQLKQFGSNPALILQHLEKQQKQQQQQSLSRLRGQQQKDLEVLSCASNEVKQTTKMSQIVKVKQKLSPTTLQRQLLGVQTIAQSQLIRAKSKQRRPSNPQVQDQQKNKNQPSHSQYVSPPPTHHQRTNSDQFAYNMQAMCSPVSDCEDSEYGENGRVDGYGEYDRDHHAFNVFEQESRQGKTMPGTQKQLTSTEIKNNQNIQALKSQPATQQSLALKIALNNQQNIRRISVSKKKSASSKLQQRQLMKSCSNLPNQSSNSQLSGSQAVIQLASKIAQNLVTSGKSGASQESQHLLKRDLGQSRNNQQLQMLNKNMTQLCLPNNGRTSGIKLQTMSSQAIQKTLLNQQILASSQSMKLQQQMNPKPQKRLITKHQQTKKNGSHIQGPSTTASKTSNVPSASTNQLKMKFVQSMPFNSTMTNNTQPPIQSRNNQNTFFQLSSPGLTKNSQGSFRGAIEKQLLQLQTMQSLQQTGVGHHLYASQQNLNGLRRQQQRDNGVLLAGGSAQPSSTVQLKQKNNHQLHTQSGLILGAAPKSAAATTSS